MKIPIIFYIEDTKIYLHHDEYQWCIGEGQSINKKTGKISYSKNNYYRTMEGVVQYMVHAGLNSLDITNLVDLQLAIEQLTIKFEKQLTKRIKEETKETNYE